MDNHDLALAISREIFKVGEDRGRRVHRIQFMTGDTQNEQPMGGLGGSSLTAVIERVLVSKDAPSWVSGRLPDVQGDNPMDRAARMEAELRAMPRYSFPGEDERWARIDVLLEGSTPSGEAKL